MKRLAGDEPKIDLSEAYRVILEELERLEAEDRMQ